MERPSDNWSGEPVFWFELEPEGYSYGMGFWMAPAVTMAKFRARMDRDPKPMEQLARAFRRQDRFVLDGVDYKRPKGEAAKLLAPWYNKRASVWGMRALTTRCAWSHDLADQLLEGYEFLLPYYQYMMDVDRRPGSARTIYKIYSEISSASAAHTKSDGFGKAAGGYEQVWTAAEGVRIGPRPSAALCFDGGGAADGTSCGGGGGRGSCGRHGGISSVQAGQKLIALTFDDGPRRSTTTRLLDGLAERGSERHVLPHRRPGGGKPATWCGAWTRKAIRSACTPMTM
ncbi:MAG: DUF2461 family protein [Oscillospiraceae bacterium]